MSNPNAVLDSAFPFMQEQERADVSKASQTPQVADGAELMNRVAGKTENKGPGRTGRPKKRSPQLHTHPKNPRLTNLVYKNEEQTIVAAGSVFQIVYADGSKQTVALLHNAKFFPLTEAE